MELYKMNREQLARERYSTSYENLSDDKQAEIDEELNKTYDELEME